MIWQTKQPTHLDQCIIEDLETNPHSYSHLEKGVKNTCWKKDSHLTKLYCDNYKSASRRMILNACLLSCTKTHSKYIKKNINI